MYYTGKLVFCLKQKHSALNPAPQCCSSHITIQAAEGVHSLNGPLFFSPEVFIIINGNPLQSRMIVFHDCLISGSEDG